MSGRFLAFSTWLLLGAMQGVFAMGTLVTVPGSTPQSALPLQPFPNPIAVLLRDSANNPWPGVEIRFYAPGSAVTGHFDGNASEIRTMTNAQGIASAGIFTAGPVVGSMRVSVGVPVPASAPVITLDTPTFDLTVTAPPSTPGQKHWSGAGTTDKWSESANWIEFMPPRDGDLLIFPDGVARNASFNDIGGRYLGIRVTNISNGHLFNGYGLSLTGDNPIRLEGTTTSAQFNCEVLLYSNAATISLFNPAPTPGGNMPQVRFNGRLFPASGTLLFDGPAGMFDFPGGIYDYSSGTIITFSGYSTLTGNNTFSSPIQSNGPLMSVWGSPLGNLPAGIRVNSGVLALGQSLEPAPTSIPPLDLRAPPQPFGGASVIVLGAPGGTTPLSAPISITGTQIFAFGTVTGRLFSPISGTGKLVLWPQGGERIFFGNSGNSFSGGLQIYAGTVKVGNSGAIPAASVLEIMSGATLELSAPATVQGFSCYAGGTLALSLGNAISVTSAPPAVDCSLRLDVPTSFSIPASGEALLIGNASGRSVISTFQGLPEGAQAAVVNGVPLFITYRGGAGRDIVIRKASLIPPAPIPSVNGLGPDGRVITLSRFTSASDCTISRAQFIDPRVAPLPAPMPAGLAFPRGLLDFRVDNCGAGRTVNFAVEYADPLPPTATYWKFGPTPDNRTAHWYSMPGSIDGKRFTFSIVDGGLGDDDLTANGSITDMGGLAVNGGTLQDLWWSGTAENGWGMSIIQHRDILFANVYVYDNAGRPMWLVIPGGAWNAAHTAFTGGLYIPHGSPFYAYDVSRFNIGAAVGTATFTFSDENSAVFDYTINGVAGRKNITRLAFGRPEVVATPALGDLWWGGVAQNGWGITVLQQVRTLFSLWFTYDANGDPTWYVMPGGEWTSSEIYEGRIYRAVGSAWVGATYDPAQHRTIDVGSYRLRFTGESATLEYSIEGRSGTVPLTRLAF